MSDIRPLPLPRLGETCYRIDHPTGLTIFVWPRPGFRTTHALFAARYGSIHTAFRAADGTVVTAPAGVAHYLEHKLFESEEGDVSERFAAIGASANAYTTFGHTAYLFSCTDRAPEALGLLLDFVQTPYFTDETVEKERGIIAQEIRMGEDSPSRTVLFRLLEALYRRHPVRVDIAGTVESIAGITPEWLYTCYGAFYNLHNMVLSVCGNITPEEVAEAADRYLRPCDDFVPAALPIDEPPEAVESYVECVMPVAAPLFCFGYKDPLPDGKLRTAAELAAITVLNDLLVGRGSPLYKRLMEEELINDDFGGDYYGGEGFGTWIFSGESRDPRAVAAAIRDEIARLRREGIDPVRFTAARNAYYGHLVASCNAVESCAEILLNDWLDRRAPHEMLEAVARLTLADVEILLRDAFREEASALSVIKGKDDQK